jgi:hypothetical protein
MSMTKAGAAKIAARRIGVPLLVYLAEIDCGRKWCSKCPGFRDQDQFGSDRSRADGLAVVCRECRKR